MKMMNYILIVMTMMLHVMCGSPGNTEGILQTFNSLAEIDNEQQIKGFYTSDTLKVANKLYKQYPGTDILLGLDKKIFTREARWKKVAEDRKGDTCLVTIQIMEHPVINMRGATLALKLHYEAGRWKIDRVDDLKKRLQ